jgi:putative endonuclease
VLAHRFRLGRHDVDLVARQGDVIAFVEVKTRRSEAFGGARQAVGWRKRLVLELVAAGWITDRGRPEWRYRFDLIEVAWGRGQGSYPHVSHIEDAWRGVRK